MKTLAFLSLAIPALGNELDRVVRRTAEAKVFAPVVPYSAPTQAPELRWAQEDSRRLFGRASLGPDTCGYIDATDSFIPFTCRPGGVCTNLPNQSFRNCCTGSTCSSSTAYYTTCLDYSAPACAATNSVGGNTLCCTFTSSFPYCITFLYTTTANPGVVFTMYNCDRSAFSGSRFVMTDNPPFLTRPTSTSARTTSSSSIATTTAVSSSTTSSPPASSSASSDSAGAPVGPIVGGVVGGVAVIALVGFGVFFIMRKKKNQEQEQPPAPHQMVQATGTTYNPGGPAPGMYDPNYAGYYQGSAQAKSPGDYSATPVSSQLHGNNNLPGFGNHPSPPPHQGGFVPGQQQLHPDMSITPDLTGTSGRSPTADGWGATPPANRRISELGTTENTPGSQHNRIELA